MDMTMNTLIRPMFMVMLSSPWPLKGQVVKQYSKFSGHDLYGFEYQPKEDAEIKQRNDKLIFIRDYFSKLFQIENNKCLFSAKDIEVENIDNHTSVLATYSIKCDKALKQTKYHRQYWSAPQRVRKT
jgi:hypothetical protein